MAPMRTAPWVLCFAVALFGSSLSTARAEEPPAGKSAAGADAAARVSYYEQVRPILQAHCQGCHQPAKRGGEYLLTSHAGLLAAGESELAGVVPGEPDESYLIELITPEGDKAEMPKGKPPLAADEIELIVRWIREGATDDTPAGAAAAHDSDRPPSYKLPPVITALDYAPDGSLLAVSGYHEVLLHKPDGSEIVGRLVGLAERIESIRFSPDGKLLAVAGGLPARMGELQLWDVEKRALKRSLPITFDTIYGVSFSPDGKLVAVGCSSDNTVRAFDVASGKQVLFQGAHDDWVLDTVFSIKGTHLVSVGRDRTAKLIEVATQRFIDNITSITPGALKGGIGCIDRHPTKDELLVGGADGVPKIYRMFREKARKIGDDFNRIRTFEAMPGRVFSVQYAPDGKTILAGSSYNGQGEVRLYQEGDGKLLWKRATGPIYAVRYRPDGKQVAAAGFDGQVIVIDVASGKEAQQFVPVPLEREEQKEVAAATADGKTETTTDTATQGAAQTEP